MGMYTWLSKNDIENWSKVSDKELNELFQEVRKFMPNLFISERIIESQSFFRKKKTIATYTIYHLVDKKITDYTEARVMNLNTSSSPLVYNYLCGLHNGYHASISNSK